MERKGPADPDPKFNSMNPRIRTRICLKNATDPAKDLFSNTQLAARKRLTFLEQQVRIHEGGGAEAGSPPGAHEAGEGGQVGIVEVGAAGSAPERVEQLVDGGAAARHHLLDDLEVGILVLFRLEQRLCGHWKERDTIRYNDVDCSVEDPGCLSRILIFTHPGSRIQKQEQKRGVKKNFCHTFFL
jgi:hypothetical protein